MMKSEGDTGMNGDSDIQFIDMWGPFLIKVTFNASTHIIM